MAQTKLGGGRNREKSREEGEIGKKVGRREKLARKVGRREIYPLFPPPPFLANGRAPANGNYENIHFAPPCFRGLSHLG